MTLIGTTWRLAVDVEIKHARVLDAIHRVAGLVLGDVRCAQETSEQTASARLEQIPYACTKCGAEAS